MGDPVSYATKKSHVNTIPQPGKALPSYDRMGVRVAYQYNFSASCTWRDVR